MKKTELEKIKDDFSVFSNGEYVVLCGKKLYIFKTDGTLIACRKDLCWAGRITFLPESRMLLCCKAVFYMIDLRDGSDLWTAPYRKTEFNLSDLVLSPDSAYAYTYDRWRNNNFITRLDLNTHEVEI